MTEADRAADAPAEEEVVEATAEPAHDPETGIALYGDYPVNRRLRAEALSKAGKDEDPDGIVSAELIADAGARLARDAEAEAAARPPVSASMKREDLDAIAANEGLDPAAYANRPDLVAAIEEKRAGGSAGGQASADPPPPPPPPAPAAQTQTETQEG